MAKEIPNQTERVRVRVKATLIQKEKEMAKEIPNQTARVRVSHTPLQNSYHMHSLALLAISELFVSREKESLWVD
ncbi:MAG: hypothetical protein V1487_00900 [bacterium]